MSLTVKRAAAEDEQAVAALWRACNMVASYDDPVADSPNIRACVKETGQNTGVDQMTRPRTLKKVMLPIAEFRAMQPEHRYAVLLLGLFLNEANWLRKLLVKAALGITDGPEGVANFALTALLATTLGGKIHEGWDKITRGRLRGILSNVGLPSELTKLQGEISAMLSAKTLLRIRNNIAFHYPDRIFEFTKLDALLDDADSFIYMVPEGYQGDVLSYLSLLAGIEPLLALNSHTDYRVSLKSVWDQLTHVAGLYCLFVSEAMALLLARIPNLSVEDVIIPDAPEADADPLRFFVHPPSDLEGMRAAVENDSTPT